MKSMGAACVEYLRWHVRVCDLDSVRELFPLRGDRLGVSRSTLCIPLTFVVLLLPRSGACCKPAQSGRRSITPALAHYWQITPHPAKRLCFQDVKRLLPRHTLALAGRQNRNQALLGCDLPRLRMAPAGSDYIEEWTEMFRTSVRLRFDGDVPLGMFSLRRTTRRHSPRS